VLRRVWQQYYEVESTFSQGVRAMGLRRSRSDGLVRTHVQQVLTAVAITGYFSHT
jgi:hypothetical protein